MKKDCFDLWSYHDGSYLLNFDKKGYLVHGIKEERHHLTQKN